MNTRQILNEIKQIDGFLKNHKEYLTNDKYTKYNTTLNELGVKAKLKYIENNLINSLSLKSDKEYLKARNLLKKSYKDIKRLEDEMINLKNQINNELNSVKDICYLAKTLQ
ncbi:hypothetical protein [Methanococcus aeolicus]|uniref:hypothetical protein n=1 Tax=Methanococcus aeolicus TaxID=42879 RepID=UPI0021C79A7F|nr:hypothetical protein [Methanococcus aeolicus]UXM84171.1 hypothetical protein N6C89_05275 [Methanococcus aeolicus]